MRKEWWLLEEEPPDTLQLRLSGAHHCFQYHIDVSSSRKEGFRGPISLVCKEPHLPYDRPKLSKSLGVCRSGHYKGHTTNNASVLLLS